MVCYSLVNPSSSSSTPNIVIYHSVKLGYIFLNNFEKCTFALSTQHVAKTWRILYELLCFCMKSFSSKAFYTSLLQLSWSRWLGRACRTPPLSCPPYTSSSSTPCRGSSSGSTYRGLTRGETGQVWGRWSVVLNHSESTNSIFRFTFLVYLFWCCFSIQMYIQMLSVFVQFLVSVIIQCRVT